MGPIVEEFIFRFMCIAIFFLFFININAQITTITKSKKLKDQCKFFILVIIIWFFFAIELGSILINLFFNSILLSVNTIIWISLIILIILIIIAIFIPQIGQEEIGNSKNFLFLALVIFSSFSWAASHIQAYGVLRLISVFFIGIGTSLAFISITNLQEFSKDFPLSKKIYSLGIGIIMVILAHACNNSLPYIFPNQDFFTQIFVLVLDVIGIGILFLIWYIICYKLIILNKNFNILM